MTTTREQQLARQILAAYNLEPVEIFDRQMGYRNRSYPALLARGEHANVIIYKPDADILIRIKNANFVGSWLASRGLPARRPLDPRITQLQSASRTKYACIYNYLPGHTIPWEGYTQKHLKLLGWTMGEMHQQLAGITLPVATTATAEYVANVHRMRLYFSQPSVKHALDAKLNLTVDPAIFAHFAQLLHACGDLPHQQILHLDFVRSNILFGTEGHFQIGDVAVTGIIDFEKTAVGHPAFDLARTLAFLLVDCKYKPEAKIRKYFLHSGYAKRGRQPLPPNHLLEPLVTLFLTYDFYKFLRHNPYESLPQNEHFLRTRSLLEHRLLQQTTATESA